MINAHCQQSPVVYCNEKKLYHFRIFEFKSEPFCEERNSATLLSSSCDNVTQKLRQAERHKRMSDSFPFQHWTRVPNTRTVFNRTKSLPIDLSECGQDNICREHSRDDHMLLTNKYTYTRDNHIKRRTNSFHNKETYHGSCGMLKLVEDNKGELSEVRPERSKSLSHEESHRTNIVQNEALVDEQCAKMNSNLKQLSTRYQKEQLEAKSKEELISIVLELQDALKLVINE